MTRRRTARILDTPRPFLKWVGGKGQLLGELLARVDMLDDFGRYHEPFLGSGGVLGTLSPQRASASDVFTELMGIWRTLHDDVDTLIQWYSERWHRMMDGEKVEVYEQIKSSYNQAPNPADLLFLSRSCYGGVVRFRKADGFMSTPCGAHKPIHPEYGRSGIRANAICPGVVDTPMMNQLTASGLQSRESLAEMHALGRVVRPDEIANLVLFLASEQSSALTGAAIVIDAGLTSGLGLTGLPPFGGGSDPTV